MLLGIRTWLFAITILLLAEDFQYLLEVGNAFSKHAVTVEMADYESDNGEEEEGKKESEEKSEKKEKDDDNNNWPELLACHIFRSTLSSITCVPSLLISVAGDLESPPPEH